MTTEAVEVLMPEVAASMTSATLAAWLKQPGDSVKAGEPIAEVETDKTTVELEAPADGILDRIRVDAGTEGVEVGTLLGLIRPPTADESLVEPPPAEPPPADPPMPVAPPPTAPGFPAGGTEPSPEPASPPSASNEAPSVTPLAARMAAHAGIDVAAVTLDPDAGRVTMRDIEQTLGAGPPAGASAPDAAPELPPTRLESLHDSSSDTPYRDEALTAVRRVTAERMTYAKQTAPHFYLSMDCAVDRMLKRRARANAAAAMNEALTLNDIIVRAAALALAAVPEANVAWTGAGIRRFGRVDLAVAVATDSGLVTPIVRSADTKCVTTIAAELRDLTDRARDGKLAPEEYAGGTCTVSNLGMFGISSLYPILNPPQGCIFGIGALEERPVVRKKKVRVATMLTVTLAADHRALDGATGADLLRTFRALLEDPRLLFA
ncbi:MAG: 2-oxo acid dehydrogenase subunit E2 [Acidobacteria bacterium]|nr:2-oxo acid dehydrogenase subunit E2 [Acidobacteriota bacterium]MYD72038.1 2-oxo acid dehydrogenase subunit E2 [Acidobacteriota bacterium]MYJ03085.1 2-oxo acid dehydrogenase subunit E2 [Acidobacteriota bacterium]